MVGCSIGGLGFGNYLDNSHTHQFIPRVADVVFKPSSTGTGPVGRPPTPVTLITLEKYHAVFENKRNDFPQRIIYTRHGDAFFARMEGKSVGKEKAIEWRWHRGEPQDP